MNFRHSRKPYSKIFSSSMKIIAEMIKFYFVKLEFMVLIKIFILHSFTYIQYLFSILYAVSLYISLSVSTPLSLSFIYHISYLSFFLSFFFFFFWYFIVRFVKEHIFYKFHVQSWPKYMRQTLVLVWNSVLWEKFNFNFWTVFC